MTHEELRAALDADEQIQQAASRGPWQKMLLSGMFRGPSSEKFPHGEPIAQCIPGRGTNNIANGAFIAEARTRWPERTRQLREALDEIERLKAAGKVLAESLRTNWGGEISRKEDEACRVFEEPQ